ncbi:UDP-GlcNAc:betaGal beta-1,3-N-acetylglucosaminyltransferase-like protein 1 isoform X3 [Xiphias gladius]|uniref:UDP-GlcNAc:betaGal beta-1,3-N-acetylglucosaminyltransferase-like protein 1 isoform X3 n=1 Tax=Xiphias gladius TaxID=8245 RepID=UPI001A986C19|nr:UDP-GlcNAc:betaGal beta-1,3-N-acetylglucosaminyltransferase-like protein 1 isoform X3 [Xiphias gladius]
MSGLHVLLILPAWITLFRHRLSLQATTHFTVLSLAISSYPVFNQLQRPRTSANCFVVAHMSSGLSERRRDRVSEVNMNPPKRLRAAGSGAETPRGEQGGERSAVDVDDSRKVVEGWRERLEARGIAVAISSHSSAQPRGVGYAKNKAISQSCGKYLCFQDADDVMLPQRVRLQYEASLLRPNSLLGCRVQRLPEGSTERYTRWINTITQDQLITQVYTSHGPTVVMPTWFCSRNWYLKVGPFDEGGKGVPEDLLFFYQSLRQGGGLSRVNQCLLVYRYHEKATTHSVTEHLFTDVMVPDLSTFTWETIWKLRVDFLQERVLSQWESFTIWNAGKQGRKLYRCLSPTNQKKVKAFCDVDEKKIQKGFYTYEESKEIPKPKIPILHYKDASAPFIICVKLDMTGGVLEENLNSLKLKEGTDYYHFN